MNVRGTVAVIVILLVGLGLLTDLSSTVLDRVAHPSTVPGLVTRALAQASAPVYRPPLRGAPGARIGGGTRGSGDEALAVAVLAPDHTAQTTQEQPSLFWFISARTDFRVEFTLNDAQGVRPLLEVRLPPPARAGIQRLRLADHGVRLAPGTRYEWFVAAVADGERRSRDVLAGGAIERVEPPEAVRARASAASSSEIAAVYCEAGFWYDCVAALSDQIDARPDDAALRKQRAALLEQIGLKAVGDYDLKPRG